MINKNYHCCLKGVSILPALLVLPAMATTPNPPFFDEYFSSLSTQLHNVLAEQNSTGFEFGKIKIGTDMNSVTDGVMYGISSVENASQYIKVEQAGMPSGVANMHLDVPLDPYMTDRGMNTNKLSFFVNYLGNGITLEDFTPGSVELNADGTSYLAGRVVNGAYKSGPFVTGEGTVSVEFADFRYMFSDSFIRSVLNSAMGETGLMNSIDALNSAIENGKIEEKYFLTDSGFTVDAQYGNMIIELLSTYNDALIEKIEDFRDSLSGSIQDKVLKGFFGMSLAEFKTLDYYDISDALYSYRLELTNKLIDLSSLKLKVGEIEIDGGNVTFANNANITTSNIEIKNGANVVINSLDTKVTIDDVSITYNGQFDDTPVTSTANYTKGGMYVSGTNTNFTVNTGANFEIDGPQLSVTDGATLVNNGVLKINTTNATIDGDITGTGGLVVGENSTLNIGTNNINQTYITLNGTMNATVRNGDDAQLIANTFNGNGTLNLSFVTDGTYHVFGNGVFNEASTNVTGINVNSSLYQLNWINEGKDLEVALKTTPDIATDNELSGTAAATVAGLAGSSSEVLNELSVAIQEKLAEGTPEAIREVEQAAAAINPETESVSKTVSNSIQNALTDLVSSRLAMLSVGRSAGDIAGFTSGGVWAHGLYNKTKLNDSFNGYTRGVALGLDGKIGHDVTVGAGYSFNHSDVALNSGDTDIDSNTVFVYGQYKPSGWFVNGVMNYTWSEYEEKGLSSMVQKTSKYDADSFGAAISGGYEFNFGLTLGLGARYLHVNGESYTTSLGSKETFDSTDYLTGIFGAKWGLNIKTSENSLIRPELRYALKYDVLSDATMATVMMPGTAAYTLTGDRLPRIGNEFGLGLVMKYSAVALSLSYDIEIRDDYTSQTGMARIRYRF